MARKPPKSPEQRLARWSRSMAPGTLNGRVASATPLTVDVTRLAPRLRQQPPPSDGPAVFTWAARRAITLFANPVASVTSVSSFAFIDALLAPSIFTSSVSVDDDTFHWDSSTPDALLIKTDGIYSFRTQVTFAPDPGAAIEFYASISGGDAFPDTNPGAFQPGPTDPQTGNVYMTYQVKGGSTISYSLDAYGGPATGSSSLLYLAVCKVATY